MLEKAVLLVLGALVSALGFMLKRRFERKPILESLDIHAKLLSINKELTAQGLTAKDLADLEREITQKPLAIQRHVREFEQAARPVLEQPPGAPLTQSDLHVRASDNLETAKLRMEQVLDELEPLLDSQELDALKKAHTAWESYSVEQAEAAAASYRGGTLQPMMFLSELERLTIDRTAYLQAELDERRNR